MMLVNVSIRMGVVGHDAGFPTLRAPNLEQDRVLNRPRAGAPVDDLHVVGPRNRMDALAILVQAGEPNVRASAGLPGLCRYPNQSGQLFLAPVIRTPVRWLE